jgi:hypothetical protein
MKYILSIDKTINVLLLLSLIGIGITLEPELFRMKSDWREVLQRLCLSYVSSYIFFFVVVHVKKEKDKANINSFIVPKILAACSQWKPQLRDICNAASVVVPEELPDRTFLANVFSKLRPKYLSPLKNAQGNYANWQEYFWYHKTRVDGFIGVVTDKMPFLDSKLVKLLSELSECEHFQYLALLQTSIEQNTNLSTLSDRFYEYCVKSQELEIYAHKKLHVG